MKKIILILILIFSIFTGKITLASIAAPSPICDINADVVKVKKISDYYSVILNITKISTAQQEGSMLCDESYINFIKDRGYTLLFLNEYNKTPIHEGQKIQANVHFGGDEEISGFSISNIKILEDVKKVALNHSYYIIPVGLGLLIGILLVIFKKKKTI